MSTVWLLLGMYEGRPLIPAADVARDFFGHFGGEKLIRKVDAGDIDLPLIRIENSSKAARYVDVRDLATYLDARSREARELVAKVHGRRPGDG